MEPKKSHELPFASWKPRKASGVIESESESFGIRKPIVEILVSGQEKWDGMS